MASERGKVRTGGPERTLPANLDRPVKRNSGGDWRTIETAGLPD
jgi:hypothetical protein